MGQQLRERVCMVYGRTNQTNKTKNWKEYTFVPLQNLIQALAAFLPAGRHRFGLATALRVFDLLPRYIPVVDALSAAAAAAIVLRGGAVVVVVTGRNEAGAHAVLFFLFPRAKGGPGGNFVIRKKVVFFVFCFLFLKRSEQ